MNSHAMKDLPASGANAPDDRLVEKLPHDRLVEKLPHDRLVDALPDDGLLEALAESRQRWRDLVLVAADIAFETDAAGRFTFIAPDVTLGWAASRLLGQGAEMLLAGTTPGTVFNPFRTSQPLRRRIGWVTHADGHAVCLSFSVAPLLGPDGRAAGTRGVGIDTSEQNRFDGHVAAALRRAEIIDHILLHIRQEVLAPRMMQAALDALLRAVGAEGVAVADPAGADRGAPLAHSAGSWPAEVFAAGLAMIPAEPQPGVQTGHAPGGQALLVCPAATRFDHRASLMLWRPAGARPWQAEERMVVASACGVIGMVLEHVSLQREMALQARTDALTGLLNRRAFLDEVHRRIDRLERDGLPGTLLFVDLDHFKALNDRGGHERGDEALCLAAGVLSRAVRPTDLVARLGGDEFALWLDGADELAAAERAERLRLSAPPAFRALGAAVGVQLTMSIGIACRWPGGAQDVDDVMRQADQAMYAVKRAGRGHWRVAHGDDAGPEAATGSDAGAGG